MENNTNYEIIKKAFQQRNPDLIGSTFYQLCQTLSDTFQTYRIDGFQSQHNINIEEYGDVPPMSLNMMYDFVSEKEKEILNILKILNLEDPQLKSDSVLGYTLNMTIKFTPNIYLNLRGYVSYNIDSTGTYIPGKKKFSINITHDMHMYFAYNDKRNLIPMTLRNVQWLLDSNTLSNKVAESILTNISGKYIIFKDILRDYNNGITISTPLVLNKIIDLNPQNKKMLFATYYKFPFTVPSYVNKLPLTEDYIKLKTLKKISPNKRSEFMHVPIDANQIYQTDIPIEVMNTYYTQKLKISPIKNWSDVDYEDILEDYLKMSYKTDKYFNLDIKTLNSLIKRHDEIIPRYIAKTKTIKLKIPDNSPFKKLKLPAEFEKITTGKRLKTESMYQNNCVYSYAKDINTGKCVIYSTVYEGRRYTIEIRYGKNRGYWLRQCLGYNNALKNKELNQKIDSLLHIENQKLNSSQRQGQIA